MSHLYGLILAGGRGTRFWPRSRRAQAKQVLKFFGDRSLIQQTVDRLRPVLPPDRIWILTNDHLRVEIVKQLPEVPKKQILAEPAQRNTAPAIGLAAHILQSIDPEAVMGVFPADHVIGKPRDYVRLLGIEPRWPETGYGYIEMANVQGPVKSFREKPDAATAEQFLAAGNFYWNAGMFFWKTSVLLDALRRFLPKTATLIAGLPPFSSRQFPTRLAEVFPRCENISIDFAVLEKATNVVGIPAGDIGWNDVGSWNAVYELQKRDAQGNALHGDALIQDSARNYVDGGKNKLIALLGVHDLIVVDTPDALLIADRSRAQQVGDLVKMLEKQKREDLL
jgi:mannose-1-phosphate guanylyltransferase